jgi:hydrogenase maturation protease
MMTVRAHDILLLALGNDIMGDDAAGLVAARELERRFGEQIDVIEAPVAGFALLDYLAGYKKVLILDSVLGIAHAEGTVREVTPNEFSPATFVSPHYVGLPDVIALAGKLEIDFPNEIRILVIEISDPFILREGLTPNLDSQIPHFVEEAERILERWKCEVMDRIAN